MDFVVNPVRLRYAEKEMIATVDNEDELQNFHDFNDK